MDARVSRNWGWYAPRLDWIDPPDAAQARAEHRALAALLGKRDDRLLSDVGLTRQEAEELLATGTIGRRLFAYFVTGNRR